jgi:hypothetical protein
MKVLANSGYKIPKEDLSPETLLEVEKDLTVSPNTGGGFGDPHKKAPSFPVYRESSTDRNVHCFSKGSGVEDYQKIGECFWPVAVLCGCQLGR